ncbi:MAG: type II secretion system protein [Thermoleophilia bacterium]
MIRQQHGMTLIELLVSMVILAIVSTMIVMGWTSLQSAYSATVKGSAARDNARDAVSRMTRELRSMQPATSGGSLIVSADSNEITFYSAFNNTAAANDPGTNGLGHVALVRYWYVHDANTDPEQWRIYRRRDADGDGALTANDPTMIVASNIVNGTTLPGHSEPIPVFQYFAAGNATALSTPVSDVSDIATISIRVVTDLNPEHTPTYFDLVTTIKPRN